MNKIVWCGSLVLTAVVMTVSSARAQGSESTPEFGRVAWGRDFPAALASAKASSKPVVVLFQEVPG